MITVSAICIYISVLYKHHLVDMIISIVTGRGSPIIRNGRGQGNCTKLSNFSACVYEITAATFPHLLASSTNNVR